MKRLSKEELKIENAILITKSGGKRTEREISTVHVGKKSESITNLTKRSEIVLHFVGNFAEDLRSSFREKLKNLEKPKGSKLKFHREPPCQNYWNCRHLHPH